MYFYSLCTLTIDFTHCFRLEIAVEVKRHAVNGARAALRVFVFMLSIANTLRTLQTIQCSDEKSTNFLKKRLHRLCRDRR